LRTLGRAYNRADFQEAPSRSDDEVGQLRGPAAQWRQEAEIPGCRCMIVDHKSWNFEETRQMVRALRGEKQEELVSRCLDSLKARQFYAGHHLANFEQLVVDRLMGAPEGWSPERLLLPGSSEEAKENQLLRSRLAAEATACAASLHCLLDTLSHAVAYSLGMNLGTDALSERRISLSAVKKRLSSSGAAPALALALTTIDESGDVNYLEALVNHSKHRSVIRPGLWFDAGTDLQSFSIEFEAFEFRHEKRGPPHPYPRREVKAALSHAHGAILAWIVKVGLRLNDELAKGRDDLR
jgi:hypothetical protein